MDSRGVFSCPYHTGTEVMKMRKRKRGSLRHDDETTDEIVGVLNAISVVSRRLARRLALLEKPQGKQERGTDGKVSKNAD